MIPAFAFFKIDNLIIRVCQKIDVLLSSSCAFCSICLFCYIGVVSFVHIISVFAFFKIDIDHSLMCHLSESSPCSDRNNLTLRTDVHPLTIQTLDDVAVPHRFWAMAEALPDA